MPSPSFDHYKNLRTFTYINQTHIKENLSTIQALHPGKTVIAMLKANAYGHGAVPIAKALDGNCAYFGVASIEEGIELRQNGIKKSKIMVFSGFFTPESVQNLIRFDLIPVIHSLYQIEYLKDYFQQQSAEIWLKVNTGMNRLGLNKHDFETAYQTLLNTAKPMNVMTHLAESENSDQSFTNEQLNNFYKLIENKKFHHISAYNSAAALLHPNDNKTDTIRIGLALYGATTLKSSQSQVSLKPVMSIHAHIIAIQHVKKGESIGYNRTYIASEAKKIAIVSIGYGDGYPQATPSGTPVAINNKLYYSIGKVSMDLMAIDITQAPKDITIGTMVTLFGESPCIETVAQKIGTSPYSLMTGINPRVERLYIDAPLVAEQQPKKMLSVNNTKSAT